MYPALLHYKCLYFGITKLQFRDFVLVSARCSLKCSMAVSRENTGIEFCDFMQFRGQVSARFATRGIQNPQRKEICAALILLPNGQIICNGSICSVITEICGRFDCCSAEIYGKKDLQDFVTVSHYHADLFNGSLCICYIRATAHSEKGSATIALESPLLSHPLQLTNSFWPLTKPLKWLQTPTLEPPLHPPPSGSPWMPTWLHSAPTLNFWPKSGSSWPPRHPPPQA